MVSRPALDELGKVLLTVEKNLGGEEIDAFAREVELWNEQFRNECRDESMQYVGPGEDVAEDELPLLEPSQTGATQEEEETPPQ